MADKERTEDQLRALLREAAKMLRCLASFESYAGPSERVFGPERIYELAARCEVAANAKE